MIWFGSFCAFEVEFCNSFSFLKSLFPPPLCLLSPLHSCSFPLRSDRFLSESRQSLWDWKRTMSVREIVAPMWKSSGFTGWSPLQQFSLPKRLAASKAKLKSNWLATGTARYATRKSAGSVDSFNPCHSDHIFESQPLSLKKQTKLWGFPHPRLSCKMTEHCSENNG